MKRGMQGMMCLIWESIAQAPTVLHHYNGPRRRETNIVGGRPIRFHTQYFNHQPPLISLKNKLFDTSKLWNAKTLEYSWPYFGFSEMGLGQYNSIATIKSMIVNVVTISNPEFQLSELTTWNVIFLSTHSAPSGAISAPVSQGKVAAVGWVRLASTFDAPVML